MEKARSQGTELAGVSKRRNASSAISGEYCMANDQKVIGSFLISGSHNSLAFKALSHPAIVNETFLSLDVVLRR